jgi:hypothetical protein
MTGMSYKTLGLGLGLFSIALGTAELFGARRIAHALNADGHETLIRGFGARELVAGAGLLAAPANASGVWNRVAGDGMDLAALGAALRRSPNNRIVWGSLAFVIGATVLDVVVARGLDRTTGRTFPVQT